MSVEIISIASLVAFYSPDRLNLVSDISVLIYFIGVLIVIKKIYQKYKNIDDSGGYRQRKVYTRNLIPINWKRRFEGKWDLHARTGFKDFLINFMGKSSFIAGMADKKPSSVIIKFQNSTAEDVIKLDSVGVPEVEGPWVVVGQEEFTKTSQEGKIVFEKDWFDEEKKVYYRIRESAEHNGGYTNYQERYINEKGFLVTDVTYTRASDKAFCKIYMEQKKVDK